MALKLVCVSVSVFHQQRSPLALDGPGWNLDMRLLSLVVDAKFLSLQMHTIDFISLPFTEVALSKTCLYIIYLTVYQFFSIFFIVGGHKEITQTEWISWTDNRGKTNNCKIISQGYWLLTVKEKQDIPLYSFATC